MSKTADAIAWIPWQLSDLSDEQVHSISEIVATALIHIAPTATSYTLAGVRPQVKVASETAAWMHAGSDELQTARVLAADSGSGPMALVDPRVTDPDAVAPDTTPLHLCGSRTPENVDKLPPLTFAPISARRAFLRDVDSLVAIYAREREASRDDYIACLRILAKLDAHRPRKPPAPVAPTRAATSAPSREQRKRWPWSRP